MNDLLKLQKNFGEHILNKKKSAILKSLPYARQDSLARLDIYRNNIFDFSYSAFSAIFPVVKKICGEEKFQKLFEKYLKKHHIKTGNLNDCGNDFPKFLKKTKPQFLSDLAQLELFYHLSYYTGEAFDFDLENFQKILEEDFYNLTFTLHPSCFLVNSKFPIASLWKKKNPKISLKNGENALVERVDNVCKIHKISDFEFIFLHNLSNKKTLFQTYKKILTIKKKEFDIGKLLNKFIAMRVISGFAIRNASSG